jgi:hypothetical protein
MGHVYRFNLLLDVGRCTNSYNHLNERARLGLHFNSSVPRTLKKGTAVHVQLYPEAQLHEAVGTASELKQFPQTLWVRHPHPSRFRDSRITLPTTTKRDLRSMNGLNRGRNYRWHFQTLFALQMVQAKNMLPRHTTSTPPVCVNKKRAIFF